MIRESSVPRANWKAQCDAVGFDFHSIGGIPYWDESVRYRFTMREIEDDLEAPTEALMALCYDAVRQIYRDEAALTRLDIPQSYWDAIAESWQAQDKDVYGRFDLAYNGHGPAKLLEFNADTPTSLLESAVVQWQWLEDLIAAGALPEDADQFNSVHERLIAAFAALGVSGPMHFTAMRAVEEDRGTIEYIRDCAQQAGLSTALIAIEDIGIDRAGQLVDLQNGPITALFKLYPWEWIAREQYAPNMIMRSVRVFEPVWKMILSNKGIAAELWRLDPGHPNLLEAYYADDPQAAKLTGARFVKPLLSREGANITFRNAGGETISTDGIYGGRRAIAQAAGPVFSERGLTAVLGSWVVAGAAAGMCVREESGPITTNRSRFIPHYIVE
jgi:glutathionylspermidine synthase